MRYLYLILIGLLSIASYAQLDNPGFVGGLNRSSSTLRNGLVAYWRFDDNGNDELGTYNLSTVGSVTYNNGLFGKAFTNNNTAGIRMESPNATDFSDLTDNFSVSVWCFLNGTTTEGIIGKFNSTANRRSWLVTVNGDIELNVSTNGTAAVTLGSTTNTTLIWHHAVMVVSNAYVRLYVNGNVSAEQQLNSALYSNSSDKLAVGATVNNTSPMDGAIDEVLIYNRVLSSAEVLELYNNRTGKQP